jgi:hypothetical protein
VSPAPQPCTLSVGARGIEPRHSCSQGMRTAVALGAVGFTFSDTSRRPQVRGEGLEPSRTASKAAGLPLADPRECPAGVEPAYPGWGPDAWPLGQGHTRRKERESNPQEACAPAAFEAVPVTSRFALPRAAAAGLEPAVVWLTASRPTVGPRRIIVSEVRLELTFSAFRKPRPLQLVHSLPFSQDGGTRTHILDHPKVADYPSFPTS